AINATFTIGNRRAGMPSERGSMSPLSSYALAPASAKSPIGCENHAVRSPRDTTRNVDESDAEAAAAVPQGPNGYGPERGPILTPAANPLRAKHGLPGLRRLNAWRRRTERRSARPESPRRPPAARGVVARVRSRLDCDEVDDLAHAWSGPRSPERLVAFVIRPHDPGERDDITILADDELVCVDGRPLLERVADRGLDWDRRAGGHLDLQVVFQRNDARNARGDPPGFFILPRPGREALQHDTAVADVRIDRERHAAVDGEGT